MSGRWCLAILVVAVGVVAVAQGAFGGLAPGASSRGAKSALPASAVEPASAHAGKERPTAAGGVSLPTQPVPATRLGPTGAMVLPADTDRLRALAMGADASSLSMSTPAPMGVSDLGVDANGSYAYGTSSFEGTLRLTSFSAFSPTNVSDPSDPSPEWVLLQLDAVAVNVTLPPARSNGTFWVQNVLHFNGSAVQPEDDIWNYSANSSQELPPSTLEGLHGKVVDDNETYVGMGRNLSVTPPSPTAPLTIELFDNITTTAGHTAVSFGYLVQGRGGTYDTVTFGGTPSPTPDSQFLVDGAVHNGGGLFYDAEFVLGGNGGGANANVVAINGTATLDRYSAGYSPVPAAFDFGVDAAETALGVAVAYRGTTAYLTGGPSFLYGLWDTNGTNASHVAPAASPGWIDVRISVTPSYAFLFATTNASLRTGSLRSANYSYAPTNVTGYLTTYLPPPTAGDPYVFTAWADGFTNRTVVVASNSTGVLSLALNGSSSVLDAPVYLRGTAQALAFSAHVKAAGYSASQKKVWLNASQDALAAPFLRVNGLDYPTFTLLATLSVNLSIDVNGFVQAPATFNYSDEAGTVVPFAGWTQGYFFYSGDGNYTVENTTVEGVPPLAPATPAITPPCTIEFYGTSNATVTNVTVNHDAVGVTVLNSTSARVENVRVEGGGLGVSVVNSSHVTVSSSSATGLDAIYLFPSVVVDVLSSSSVTAEGLSVTDAADGVASQGASDLTVSQLTAASGAVGLDVNDTDASSVAGLSVVGGAADAGTWSNSSLVSFTSIDVNGTGLVLTYDSSVTVTGGSATGFRSTVVDSFNYSSFGTFKDLAATDGAVGVNLSYCADVNVSGISASFGSVGAFLSNAASSSGTGYASSELSVGLFLSNVTVGPSTFTSLSATNQSIAALVMNSTDVDLASVEASNTTLGASAYLETYGLTTYPIAGVALINDTAVNVTGVAATDYPFAVWSNNSTDVAIWQVTALYGVEAVSLDWTNLSSVGEVFAFAELVGISVQNCTGTTVGASTLEVSSGVGLELANGSADVVENDSFVGNNGSSVSGAFNGSHLQAYSNNSTDPTFRSDYWSDHSGSGAYVINASGRVRDTTPRSSFYLTYLEFTERGLPGGVNWTVMLGVQGYATNASLFYIPGWAIRDGRLDFSVVPIFGYPAHPSSGSVTWSGSSQTESIVFGSGPGSSGYGLLPWLVVAAVAVAGIAGGAVYLLRRRRPPPRPGAPGGPPPAGGTGGIPPPQG